MLIADTFSVTKAVHMASVALSGSFFLLRGLWMLLESALLDRRFVRIAPHVIDAVLLLSGILLVLITRQYPFATTWLTVKLCAVVVYIVLGVLAIRRGPTKRVRAVSLVLALMVFGFVVVLATRRELVPVGIN